MNRILGYLKGIEGCTFLLCTKRPLNVQANIDVADALHYNLKSHTGAIKYMGGVLAYAFSCKEKIMTKSPTGTN